MRILLILAVLAAATSAALARPWPRWESAHVSEIRFRDGVPGTEVRLVKDRAEIDKVLVIFRRAHATTNPATTDRTWDVCVDFVGKRPEDGRWLLNLETGDCTYLDPLIKPVYQIPEADRGILKTYFLRSNVTRRRAPESTEPRRAE